MNYQAHRIGGVCAGTITATFAYQETFGNLSSWDVDSIATLSIVLVGSIFGSLLPDIDHPTSKMGRRVPIVSRTVNTIFGHRGFTHSLLAFLLLGYGLFLLSGFIPASVSGYYLPLAFGVIVGYGSHLLLDMLTVSGIPLFYPFVMTPIKLANLRSGKDDLLVSVVLVILTGSYLYIFNII